MTAVASHALVGNRGFVEAMIGFETVTRAMRLVMAQGLNAEIDRQSDKWRAADLELQALGFDPGVGQVTVEHVDPSHLHEGPHQSFLKAPPEAFPNVSVMAYLVVPTSTSGFGDQLDSSQLTLSVESMVKAGPVGDGLDTAFETIVHRRIQRMTEAVNAVMRRNPGLLGAVAPIQEPARGGIGQQSWVRREEKGSGPRFMWQGSRLEYTAQRASTFS